MRHRRWIGVPPHKQRIVNDSFLRHKHHWTRAGRAYARNFGKFAGFGPAAAAVAIAAAGYKNLRTKVPQLNQEVRTMPRVVGAKRARRQYEQGNSEDKAINVAGGLWLNDRDRRGRRPKHDVRNAWKHIMANTESYVLRYGGVKTWGAAFGSNLLQHIRATTSGTYFQPFHFFRMSGAINNPGGVSTFPTCGPYIASFDNATGNVSFVANGTIQNQWIQAKDTANAINPNRTWYLERTTTAGSTTLNSNKMGYWDWLSTKFMFYLPKTLPCIVKVMFVQFKREFSPVNPPTAANDLTDYNNFYSSWFKKYTASPIFHLDPKAMQGKMRVLHSRTFKNEPDQLTTTADALPKLWQYEWFWRPNRLQRFDWRERVANPNQYQAPDESFTSISGNCDTDPDYDKEVWCIVAANTPRAADTADASITGASATTQNTVTSYDWQFRSGRSVVS